ncbi:MAG TPA: hypothetical protein PLQ05_09505 [Acidobacteriota bacterium]|jgi:hypothetical protein|nr:hypothetical protein [Acidobacteriota bacterium]
MNRDWVLFNLKEAEEELHRTIAEIEMMKNMIMESFLSPCNICTIISIQPGIQKMKAPQEWRTKPIKCFSSGENIQPI